MNLVDLSLIAHFFALEFNITLQFPDLPVVDTGSRARPIYIPSELCEIEPGQPYGKLDDQEVAQMIKFACNKPGLTAAFIQNEGLAAFKFTQATQAAPIKGFGITIAEEMTAVPGRELPPPSLSYKVGKPNVRDGSWNILDIKFHRGVVIQRACVLVVRDGGRDKFNGPADPELKNVVDAFFKKLKDCGITITTPPKVIFTEMLPAPNQDPGRVKALAHIADTIKKNMEPRNKALTFVLLSRVDKFIYPGIKTLGDVKLGIHTVHMLLDKVLPKAPNQRDQYYSNIALKVNSKLGGIDHKLDGSAMAWLNKKPTMMIGMDVTHPGPTSAAGTPSIAA